MAHVIRDKKKMLDRVRRIRGQVESVERSLEGDAECGDILHTIAACQGAINGLMAELIAGHIRFHVVGPRVSPNSPQARAAEELIDVIRKYVH